MNKEKTISLIKEFQNNILKVEGIERSYEKEIFNSIGSKPIKIITGFRRSGKTFLTQKVLKKLIEKNLIRIENILYLNFEDFRFIPINTAEKLYGVYEIFLSAISKKGKKLIVLDEIQYVTNWDKLVRTIYEKESKLKDGTEIILSGSNSGLLSAELSSNLAGRFIEFYIQPFSFKELLTYHNIKLKTTNDYFQHSEDIKKYFYEYIKYGGLAEILTIQDEKTKYSYIEGIINKVILDDVIKRYNIKNVALIEKILYFLVANIGNVISFANIEKYTKELEDNIKQNTIINYVQCFQKCFALFEVNKFDWKAKKVFNTSKKYYAIDLGLTNLYKGLTNNFSKQLENILFLHLYRKYEIKEIYYGHSYKEIDFICKLRNGNFIKYQVCQELTSTNQERELSPFVLIDKYLETGKNYLLTLDDSDEDLIFRGKKVFKRNLIKYLALDK